MTPDRFFSLVLVLQTRDDVTTGDLAEQLGVSVRTVLRDVQWLQDAGFPIIVTRGRHGGVRLLPGGALDTSRLTPQERDHLALHGLDDTQRQQLGTGADSDRARAKLTARRPVADVLPLSAVIVTDNAPWFGGDPRGTDPSALIGDIRRGVRLRIRYRRSTETEPTWQVVDPHGLLAKAGRWYLVAEHQRTPRLYSLERLAGWRALRTPRRLHHGPLADVAGQLTSHWQTGDTFDVHALLDAEQLERARRILGSRLTADEPAEPGFVRLTVACRDVEDVRQLLPFAGSLTVTAPAAARTRMRDLAREIAARYPPHPTEQVTST
ncbi:helix-turn-helix transcriptional regulator [Mycolicibacterium vaccae]|uniref:helix-turn-helix transcriptional regulator n=1 Tax=Mycolicibacterium vaccae TaxID=1810 RepID=UPI003D081AF4